MKTEFDILLEETYQAQIESSCLLHLHFNNFDDAQKPTFSHTRLAHPDSYYYCLTGFSKEIYFHRMGVDGLEYSRIYFYYIHKKLQQLLEKHHLNGTPYLIVDNTKQIGIIFQTTETSDITPIAFAQEVNETVQRLYNIHFSIKC